MTAAHYRPAARGCEEGDPRDPQACGDRTGEVPLRGEGGHGGVGTAARRGFPGLPPGHSEGEPADGHRGPGRLRRGAASRRGDGARQGAQGPSLLLRQATGSLLDQPGPGRGEGPAGGGGRRGRPSGRATGTEPTTPAITFRY